MESTKKMRVYVADSYRLFVDGILALLGREPDIDVVGTATDVSSTIQGVKASAPDVLLFDFGLSQVQGSEFVRELASDLPQLRYIVISSSDGEKNLDIWSSAGVHGYVLKTSATRDVLTALRSVAKGEIYVDVRVADKFFGGFNKKKERQRRVEELTMREKEVLYWISQGFNNARIAQQMVLSDKTIKNHITHVLKKLQLDDRTQAAVYAWRIGLAKNPEDYLNEIS